MIDGPKAEYASHQSHLPLGAGREFDAIRAMLQVWGPRARGIGDDAAVLEVPVGQRLVVSTDASVEGVHFRREWLSPEEVGFRATAAALSDLAAMAALPIGLLLALAVPEDWSTALVALSRGVGDAAASVGCPILGGNITRARELSLTITVLGTASQPLTRSGVLAGDDIYVTGRLGGPRAAVRAWMDRGTPRADHRTRFAAPRPRITEARWLADAGCHAAIDISDGLVADAGHLALASGVHLDLDLRAVPCVSGVTIDEAVSGGEEYELIVTFASDAPIDPALFEQRFGLPLTHIGSACDGAGVALTGMTRVDHSRGHDHFS
jgi:thiamine-monophosphate kinase